MLQDHVVSLACEEDYSSPNKLPSPQYQSIAADHTSYAQTPLCDGFDEPNGRRSMYNWNALGSGISDATTPGLASLEHMFINSKKSPVSHGLRIDTRMSIQRISQIAK